MTVLVKSMLFFSHGFSFEIDSISMVYMVYEAVEYDVSQGRIADDFVPVLDG